MKIIKGKGIFIMLFLVSIDSNMAENFIIFLSAVSDYCMVCFIRKVVLKSDTAERYIYNSMCITCIIIYIYRVFLLNRCGYAKSLDVFGTSERNAPM
jgi:hypothetical protein